MSGRTRSCCMGVVALSSLVMGLAVGPPAQAVEPSPEGTWSWPVGRAGLDRTFEPPATEYGPGHRGIDIAAPAGTPVRAVAPGTVVFAGRVGRVEVVTVDHGGQRSTYQPVRASVRVGDAVERNQVLGILRSGPGHCAGPCLHLGRVVVHDGGEKKRRQYLDPLDLLGGGRYRLISPDGPPPRPPAGSGDLLRPVAGPVTSPFGLRVHPITGRRKLHDGTDFGARCGTRVRAAAGGVVGSTPTDGGYGKRVVIRHGRLSTAYAHLSSRTVRRGDHVRAGQVIGRVGSTGLSTGCHLHFMVLRGGRPQNPAQHL